MSSREERIVKREKRRIEDLLSKYMDVDLVEAAIERFEKNGREFVGNR